MQSTPQPFPPWARLTAAFVVVLAIFAACFISLYHSMGSVDESQEATLRSAELVERIEILVGLAKDAETSQRGYTIVGDESFLEPYNNARNRLTPELGQIQKLVAGDKRAEDAFEDFVDSITKVFTYQEDLVRMLRTEGRDSAMSRIRSGEGKIKMDELRRNASLLRSIAGDKLAANTVKARESADRALWATMIVSGLITGLAIILYIVLFRVVQTQVTERLRMETESWVKTGLNRLDEALRGEQGVVESCRNSLRVIADYVGAHVGNYYALEGGRLALRGGFARVGEPKAPQQLILGEGLTGEVARTRRSIHVGDAPDGYLQVASSTGAKDATSLIVTPVIFQDELLGVVEIGKLGELNELHVRLLDEMSEALGASLSSAMNRTRLQDLLAETQAQAEELQAQQEELRVTNEELEAQAQSLREAQERLQSQQEELRQTNEELEQQARALEEQRRTLMESNEQLGSTKREVERKATELERASRYKSEFLANMSHELRTPLNSMLILATLLQENHDRNLSEKQVGFAQTIFKAGNDLLALINDVLDLAKVEAGRLNFEFVDVDVDEVLGSLERDFRPLAAQKGLRFVTKREAGAPQTIRTDRQRLGQVLRNLLSNAIKFTEAGEVSVTANLQQGDRPVVFTVRDSGIGIAPKDQARIFDAFEQADGSTNRAYGGTGLGLTISRELIHVLGGRIDVTSEVGRGSEFIVTLPLQRTAQDAPLGEAERETARLRVQTAAAVGETEAHRGREGPAMRSTVLPTGEAPTPRQVVVSGDVEGDDGRPLALVIEDDETFGASILAVAREAGFRAVLARSGEDGIAFARGNHVQAILLDLKLPDISGYGVLERLKRDPVTRPVPVHVVSGVENAQNVLALGAMGYLVKPASKADLLSAFRRIEGVMSRAVKRILLVEDDQVQREAVMELLGGKDVEIDAVGTGREALEKIAKSQYDCVVLDLRLPDLPGFEVLERIEHLSGEAKPPVVIYTGKELDKDEEQRLRRYSESIILKGVRSPERLLDEVSLFLHRVESDLPADRQAMLSGLRTGEKALQGRRVLLVDDDMRNVFALVNALEAHGMVVSVGRNGKEALAQLEKDPTLELVLMDIMMPVMDGFEAMTLIRKDPRLKKLPIIALTAKAMKGDQEKCLQSGANDYLPKPVKLDRLLSLLKVWLPQQHEG